MTFKKNDSAGYLINHLSRLFARQLQAAIKPMGLSTGVFPALLELWEKDGLTQRDLVQRLDIEQATMANTLSRMERDGLIRRQADPNDGRVQQVWLTPKARALEPEAKAAARHINETALGVLSADEQALFIDLMRKVLVGRT